MGVWGHHGKHGSWVHDGVRLEYDDLRKLVNLMMGNLRVDQMSVQEFERTFGLRAAVDLTRR